MIAVKPALGVGMRAMEEVTKECEVGQKIDGLGWEKGEWLGKNGLNFVKVCVPGFCWKMEGLSCCFWLCLVFSHAPTAPQTGLCSPHSQFIPSVCAVVCYFMMQSGTDNYGINRDMHEEYEERVGGQAGNELSLVPTSEMINYTSQLLSDFRNKVHRSTLKMPALILDQKEKVISKFKSSNGLVEDPFAIEKERAMINPWTSEEREVFLEKFAAFGKNFRKIASFFDHKTTADCIEFYYKNHKSDCFEKIKKKNGGKLGKLFTAKTDLMASGKKWNCEANVASFEILNAASVMAHGIAGNRRMRSRNFLLRGYGNMKSSTGDDSITERSSSHDILRDERETVAADVLAGICGSLSSEAMSSCITSSVGPVEANRDGKCMRVRPPCKQPVMPDDIQNIDHETCSDESSDEMDPSDWTDEEKAAFLQAVSSFGKDFAMIAQCVGTRSQDQCKIFFSKARKCLGLDLVHSRPEYIGSIVNDDVNGGRSDTDDACIVETDSVIGTDKSGTKTDEDLPSSVMNTYHDESNPVEARDLSADLNESKDGEVDHVDVNMVSNACVIKGASLLGDDGSRVVLYSSDKSDSVRDLRGKIMSDSIEVRKDEVRDAVTELVSTSEVNKPCHSDSVAEDQMVSKELEGPPTCHNDRDGKHEANTDFVVELKSRNHDSSNTADSSLPSVGNSRSRLTFGAESRSQLSLDKPHFSGLSVVDPFVTANTRLQNTAGAAAEQEKTANRTCVSSCDFQGSRDMSVHSLSNGHNHNSGNLLDEVEPTRILQCYPLQVPVNKEVNMDMSSCSSANALPLVSQKIEHIGDHYKTQLQCLSDSVRTSRNGDVKLFGKILTNSSPIQKLNLTAQGNEENGTHHPKLSCTSASLKSSGHQADEKSALSKFDCVDYQGSLENVPITSHQDGNRVQSGFSSLSDSAIFLAKYPAAFSNYPASAKPEQQSLQAMVENNEQHLNGASAFTTREVNGIDSVIDFQMFTNRDGMKVQPFMIDGKHCQDVFSEMKQRINGFEAVSSLQQQGGGMVGINGVERPDIPHGGVSDPVAAIKMHYSNGGHSATMTREDEAWGGKEGDLGR
ncbi:hypothetical protein VNO77_34480 [Canavalia gladiata]|uniref:Nuclear receptor corepressor 1 n=1 Tax=Canavalia gladiata TaxID=3824 RepID=A0AAN9KGM0_CANGL